MVGYATVACASGPAPCGPRVVLVSTTVANHSPMINAGLKTSSEAIAAAHELVALLDAHAPPDPCGAFAFEGQIDHAPHLTLARQALARAGE